MADDWKPTFQTAVSEISHRGEPVAENISLEFPSRLPQTVMNGANSKDGVLEASTEIRFHLSLIPDFAAKPPMTLGSIIFLCSFPAKCFLYCIWKVSLLILRLRQTSIADLSSTLAGVSDPTVLVLFSF